MDGQAPVSVLRNSPSKATVSDHLGTATAPPLSNASSIHSSPMAESPVALGPVKYAAHLPFKPADNRSDEKPALKQGEPVAACVASPVGVSASDTPNPAFSSIVSGKSANLMSKWLPSSTSALAEPLEQEGASRKKDAPNSNIPMTPPFTPLKRSDQLSGINNSQHAQLRGTEKSRAMLMTPPATIKREQILHKPRSPLSGLTPSYRLSGKASSRGSSPNSQDLHTRPTAVETLAHQMSLLPIENHRPRSASSPMEPSSDHGPNSNLNRPLPPKADTFGLSLGESPAEYRKRAGTLCSIPSAPFGSFVSDINSPASLLLNQRKHQTPPGSLGRSQHVPNYPTSSLNMFAGVSSPLAFSHVTSYLGANHQHTEDPATLLFPASRNPSDFASNSSHSAKQPPLLVGSAAGDRHQRYHTAPTDSNPLFHSGRPSLPLSSTEGTPVTSDLVRRIEERSMSLIGSSPVDRIQSNLFNVHFRPRSSTVADTSGGRATGKSLLSVNWEGEESSKIDESEAEAASRTTGAQIGDSARPSSNRPQPWGTTLGATSPRYCKVLGIPPKLLGSMKGIVRVRNAFAAYGDLLDIHVDTLSPVGFILVGFHDTRSILNLIQNGVKALENTFGSYLKMEPLQRSDVIQLTQDFDNPVLSSNEGALNLRFEDPRGIITEDVLIEYLQRYGDLKALRAVGPSRWFVEWYDDRRADAAQKQLVARDFADFQVTVDVPEQELRSMLENQYSAGGMAGSMGNGLAPSVCLLPPTIRPPAMLNSGDQYNNTLLYRYVGEPYASNYVFPWNQTMSIPPPASYYNVHAPTSLPVDGLGGVASRNLTPDLFGSPAHRLDQQVSPHPPAAHRPRAFPFPGVPPSNVMDLDRIECGSDPRTTCMIKNIPNKITDEMLYNFINEVCPRGFDFLYLRMDFKARLNVGYAFINFLSVENVLRFAKSKLGVKWGVFLSEKTVQMCYASIQGKENLIEKFRNSAIMEEEESFRPKIYHSSGPLMGLPEPFPHANDLQRKARSQANAALLVRPPVTSINPVTQ